MPRPRKFGETAEPSQNVPATTTRPTNLATEKQVAFIHRLLDEKDLLKSPSFWDATNTMDHEEFAAYILHLKDQVSTKVTKARASGLIETLLALPNKAEVKSTTALPDVPAGRYAVLDNGGEWSFYKVDRPTEGRWAGRTFVKRLIAMGGYDNDFNEQRLDFKVTRTILEKIVSAGIQESMEAFGQKIGRCGHCGRNLTDEVSIERGIGPVCAGKMGW